MRSKKSSADTAVYRDDIGTVLKSCGVGLLVYAVIILVFSGCFSLFNLPEIAVLPLATLAVCIGAFFSGHTAAKNKRENGLLAGLCCSVVIFAVISLFSTIFVGEGFGSLAWLKAVLVALSGGAGGIIGVNRRVKRK